MATSKAKKNEILAELIEDFKSARSVTFTGYRGLTVADVTKVRRELLAKKAKLVVAKKTLIKLAAKQAGYPEITNEVLEGPVAAAFSFEDEVAAAQVLHKFGKDFEAIQLLGGVLEGEILTKSKITQLATLPSKEGLVSQLLSVLIAPLRGLAVVAQGNLVKLAVAISEIEKKKSGEAA